MTLQKKTFAQIKAEKKPVTKTVLMVLDPTIGGAYLEAKEAYEEAKTESDLHGDDKSLKATANRLKREFESAKDVVEENSVEFVLRSLGRETVDRLMDENQATKKQIAEAEDKGLEPPNWNAETFPQALVAASLIEPEVTLEDIQEMWDSEDWNQAELMTLFFTALEVQQTRRVVDLKKD